jgi:hypothetical protein
MAGRKRGIAVQARAQGADGIIIQSDNKELMGTISNGWSSGSGFAFGNGWNYNGNFGVNGFSTTTPIIQRNSTFLAIKYVNSARPVSGRTEAKQTYSGHSGSPHYRGVNSKDLLRYQNDEHNETDDGADSLRAGHRECSSRPILTIRRC